MVGGEADLRVNGRRWNSQVYQLMNGAKLLMTLRLDEVAKQSARSKVVEAFKLCITMDKAGYL